MVDASSADLLRELNEKRRRPRLLYPAILFCLVAWLLIQANEPPWVGAFSFLILTGVCGFVAMRDAVRRTTVVFYELDSEVEPIYQQVYDALGELQTCAGMWLIEAKGDVLDRKYHAGAAWLLKRSPTRLYKGHPPLVKVNIDVPVLPVGEQTLAFMPDRVLVFDKKGVGAVGYPDLALTVRQSRFIEEGPVPHDAKVIDKTWRYVNKKGGPDRRFSNNRELPICDYEELWFSSPSGLNEIVQISRRGVGIELDTAFQSISRLRTSRAATEGAASPDKNVVRGHDELTTPGPLERVLRGHQDAQPPFGSVPRQTSEHRYENRAERRIGKLGIVGISVGCLVLFGGIVSVLGPSEPTIAPAVQVTKPAKPQDRDTEKAGQPKAAHVTNTANTPVGFRVFKWGVSPISSLKKISEPTDGVIMYRPAEKPAALYGLPVAEEAYSFSNGKFYSGSAWLDGQDNFTKVKAALTREFGPTSFESETTKVWKWRWPNTQIEVTLSYQEHLMRTTVTFENKAI
jgi:hypothetical protein